MLLVITMKSDKGKEKHSRSLSKKCIFCEIQSNGKPQQVRKVRLGVSQKHHQTLCLETTNKFEEQHKGNFDKKNVKKGDIENQVFVKYLNMR